MISITLQRDLIGTLKRETILNLGILSKLQPMPAMLTEQVFKEHALEKLTQNVFNHLAYYLVSIIDSQASAALTWPLYDTKTERTYRNELAGFITNYSNKGLLAPVMSSYLVNTGHYKVTLLVFQMSQLAVQRVLENKMEKNHQTSLFNDMTEKYKSRECDGFIEHIDKETERMLSKFSNYLRKRNVMEQIGEVFRKKITEMEEKLKSINAQKYLEKLVDDFLKTREFDPDTKSQILKVKNVYEQSEIFSTWLEEVDKKINAIESRWETQMIPYYNLSKETYENTKALIARKTGEANPKSFSLEYNHKTDYIDTDELQNEVNTQQKYILKNIIRDDKLNFPNLIRGFLVAICFILKSTEISPEIYKFNEYLEGGKRNYCEVVAAMRMLAARVMNAEERLQVMPNSFLQSMCVRDLPDIPPLPDLTELKINSDFHPQLVYETFTPLQCNKYRFNLCKKQISTFTKPLPKALLITPFHHIPRSNLTRNCRMSVYEPANMTQNMHNISMVSSNRGNETVAECSGFTKQQICRLLSTKKSSSTKIHKFKTHRPPIHFKKGRLFNESNISNDSVVMLRSHSSPNLFESRRSRIKFSTLKEDSPSLLEMSGITSLESDSHSTPQTVASIEDRKLTDSFSIPAIVVSHDTQKKLDSIVNSEDLNREVEQISIISVQSSQSSRIEQRLSIESNSNVKPETPKSNPELLKKTSSLEKIINRFKKVRASVLTDHKDEGFKDIKTIMEEKENLNVNVDMFSANKVLLPDLLSPSCNVLQQTNDFMDMYDSDDEKPRRPRESLGTVLGVDHTFLDQFELID